jgi:hypothetical protein
MSQLIQFSRRPDLPYTKHKMTWVIPRILTVEKKGTIVSSAWLLRAVRKHALAEEQQVEHHHWPAEAPQCLEAPVK